MPAKAATTKKVKYTRKPKAAKGANSRRVAPGTVAILLAGKYRGRHAVVLKQLEKSGALVISGPYKYNGIPIRRVNPRYVIATSTKVALSGVDAKVLDKVDAKLFQRKLRAKGSKSAGGFLGTGKEARAKAAAAGKKKIPDERVALQKQVDAGIIASIKKDARAKLLPGYLRSVFTIKPGDAPHRMKF
jgi:large subunit ribosomal protein L6e